MCHLGVSDSSKFVVKVRIEIRYYRTSLGVPCVLLHPKKRTWSINTLLGVKELLCHPVWTNLNHLFGFMRGADRFKSAAGSKDKISA